MCMYHQCVCVIWMPLWITRHTAPKLPASGLPRAPMVIRTTSRRWRHYGVQIGLINAGAGAQSNRSLFLVDDVHHCSRDDHPASANADAPARGHFLFRGS